MEFKFDFGAFGMKQDAHPAVSAAVPGSVVRLDGRTVHWRATDGARAEVLDARVHAVLSACALFRTRDEHVRVLSQQFGMSDAQAGAALDHLTQIGLMRDPTALLRQLIAARPRLPQALIAIRTHHRPQALARLLDSLREDEQRFTAVRRYVVIDDGTDTQHTAATEQHVRAFARRARGTVYYLGPAQRPAMRAHLQRAVAPEAHACLSALTEPGPHAHKTGARTWNLALLCAAGTALSILDDDTVFPLRMPPGADTRWMQREEKLSTTHFYDDDGYLGLAPVAQDAFETLRDVVGQPLRAVLQRDGVHAQWLYGQSPSVLDMLADDAEVLSACTGNYGGFTFDSSAYLNAGTAQTMSSLWRDPYRPERLEAEAIWHGVTAPLALPFAVYTPLIIDARALLPFAGTLGRADDTYFLGLLGAMVARPVFAQMPWMLGHLPEETRHRVARSLEPLMFDRSGVIADFFNYVGSALQSNDRAARLTAIGALAGELAATSDAALNEHTLHARQRYIAALIERVRATLDAAPGAPQAWRTHAEQIIAVNRHALSHERLSTDDTTALRDAYAQTAQAAALWPALWRHCCAAPLLDGVVAPLR
jgi:hypothetical protein